MTTNSNIEIYPSLETIEDWATILTKYWNTTDVKFKLNFALERFQTTDQLQRYYDHLCETIEYETRQDWICNNKAQLAIAIIRILKEEDYCKKQRELEASQQASDSALAKAIKANTVIKCEKLAYSCVPAYMVLRQLKGGDSPEWATHFYNADQDSFEFGYYTRDFNKALASFKSRVNEYNNGVN
ncbi:MAG: hypothetical protein DI617_09135 [Streptococcus pyogenes]|nr:MAG: hypothetical protein DI617_09135 [Streptococcus pyogenes]